jgi:hypothetical protein
MIDTLPKNIIRFVLLVLVQILIFNNIEIGGYINPYVYILFILLLPFETPAWVTLSLGFGLGLIIDIFSETLGMHTAATVLISFIRPYVLSSFAPRDGYETRTLPRVLYYGLPWFIKYTIIMVLVHHLVLFYIEIFRFQDFFAILLRVILSTIFSSVLVILSQFFVFRK